MNKLVLIIDTLRRLSPAQIFFLGYNKVVKKKLNPIILKINKKNLNSSEEIEFIELKKRIELLLGSELVWSEGITHKNQTRKYYKDLESNLVHFAKENDISVFNSLWNEKTDDIEINYNYQRFYMFDEAFAELSISEELKIRLMIAWINNSTNIDYAWSGFNCAMRLINWIKILSNIDSDEIDKTNWSLIQNSIYQQHVFNKNNIEHHIPGNHILLQYYSLWLIAVLIPEWNKDNEEKQILTLLLDEVENEFLQSGLHFELSTHYHLQITLIIFYLLDHLEKLKREIPEDLRKLSLKAYLIIQSMTSNGYYPQLGDACYNFFHENKYDDLKNLFSITNRYNLSSDVIDKAQNYNDKFYVVSEYGFNIIFNVSEIGLKNNPGHGHADALSIILSYKNEPLFIDPGVRRYSNSSEDLSFKKTQSHNTVSIGDYDQSILWGFFRWAFPHKVLNRELSVDQKNRYTLSGKIRGFKNAGGINHERKVEIDRNEILITDQLDGNIKDFIQINFILHPQINASIENQKVILTSKENKFVLEHQNEDNLKLSIHSQAVYDEYDRYERTKKIVFMSHNKTDKFYSRILLKVID